MKHPVLDSNLGLPIYVVSWLGFFSSLLILLWYFDGLSLYHAFADAFCFSIPVFFLGFCIWYVVNFNKLDGNDWVGFILNHVAAAIIIIGLWISASHNLKVNMFPDLFAGHSISFHWQIFFALIIYDYILLLFYFITYHDHVKDKLTKEKDLTSLVKESELNALKSQINPHFLFNSLNSVNSLTVIKPILAREMIIKLSDFLRYSLDKDLGALSSLENELNNSKLYLDIEKIRFDEKLNLESEIDEDTLDLKLPNLILQPIFENAIKHGVSESLAPVTIKVKAYVKNSHLYVEIRNNFDIDAVSNSRKGKGIGLQNVRDRLKLIYNSNMLMFNEKTESEFVVRMVYPQEILDDGTYKF
ncbi:MAG: histidine kinase [Marinifilaceae bacterium]|nr:histidine kinase [Marinifilaceae bacterium]